MKTMKLKMNFKTLATGVVMSLAVSSITSCKEDNSLDIGDETEIFVVDKDNLQGEIKGQEVILEEGRYTLTGKLIVEEGAKLTIKPGVEIVSSKVSSDAFAAVRYIAVSQGAEIDVQGTKEKPVIMTAEEERPGAWGGLVVCGKAPTNKGKSAVAEVSELVYGGDDPEDNSGAIRFLRIEYSGFSYNNEKEFNGLSMFGVGNKTIIENVQVFEGSDDGFEWFGGTVNAKNLVVTNFAEEVGDDLFDWTEGWSGQGENWYGIRTNAGNRGIEADNNSNNHLADPISSPTIKNLTLIGAGDAGNEPQAIKLRVGTKAKFENIVLANWNTGIDIQHDEGVGYVETGDILIDGVKFINVNKKSEGKLTDNTIVDVSKAIVENESATGAGAGVDAPEWTKGWTRGL